MQTFLPYTDFKACARALDNKRLNKQILECYQILKVLSSDDPHAGWRNHPAVKMWRGYERGLWNYVTAMVAEGEKRGIRVENNVNNLVALAQANASRWGDGLPAWFNDTPTVAKVLATHKANLYLKDPIFYWFFADAINDDDNKPCCERCSYFWVTHVKENTK